MEWVPQSIEVAMQSPKDSAPAVTAVQVPSGTRLGGPSQRGALPGKRCALFGPATSPRP
ncbi:Protein of unknown function [Gryllus bimaculatus]|nr:Protein of unknown function [Gryllus bimaculatus]